MVKIENNPSPTGMSYLLPDGNWATSFDVDGLPEVQAMFWSRWGKSNGRSTNSKTQEELSQPKSLSNPQNKHRKNH